MIKLQKLTQQEIINFAEADFNKSVVNDTQSEMAIPSYLHPNPLVRWLMWRRYEVIADWLNVDEQSHVLEFGCGVGIFLPSLCSTGSTIYALDLEPSIAKKLSDEKELKVNFIESLSEVEDCSLDAVVAADVLEHLQDVSHTIDIFIQKLKPGGRLMVSGPTENQTYKLFRILAGFMGKGDYHFSNIDLLIPIIKNSGFQLIKEKELPYMFMPTLFRIVEFEKARE